MPLPFPRSRRPHSRPLRTGKALRALGARRMLGALVLSIALLPLMPVLNGGRGALEGQGMGQQMRQGTAPVRVFRIAPDFWANWDPEERQLSVQGTVVKVPPDIELERAFTPPVSDWFIVIDGVLYDDLDIAAASMGGVFDPRIVEGYVSHEMIRESYGSDWYEAGVFGFMVIRTRTAPAKVAEVTPRSGTPAGGAFP